MGKNNDYTRDQNVDQKNKEEFEKKFKSPIVFNTEGFSPNSARFVITKDDTSKAIMKRAEGILMDPKGAEVVFWQGEGTSYDAYLWIRSDSDDVCDKSLNNMKDSAIKMNTRRYSDELKRFMELYGKNVYENGKNVGPKLQFPKMNDDKYVGIQIDLLKLFTEVFDVYGNEYNKLFGGTSPVRTEISVKADTNSKGHLSSFIITKRLPDRRDRRNLIPRHSKRL